MEKAISTSSAPAEAPPHPYPYRWIVFGVVFGANIMDILDGTIVNVAGPSIRDDLGGSGSTIQWLSAGYTLAFAVFLMAAARLGDIVGRRRLFLVGSAGFTVFSTVCAVAPTMGVLIACRALQGAFGALMIPQCFPILKEVFDEKEFAKATGLFGPAMGVPMLAAPILAGALVEANLWHTGWRLVFLINVPIGLVSFLISLKVLPRGASHPGVKLDWLGVGLVGVALVALIYPLIQGQPDGWPLWTFALIAVGLALLFVFFRMVLNPHRKSDPLIEASILANRSYLGGLAVLLSLFGAFAGLLLCISLYGQLGQHWSPVHAGLTLTPMVVGMIGGFALGGALVAKLGRKVLHLGLLIIAVGMGAIALMAQFVDAPTSWDLLAGLFLVGAGFGSCMGQLFTFVLGSVTPMEMGSASGLLESSQQLSTALGVAVLGTVFFSRFGHGLPASALAITTWASFAPLVLCFFLIFLLPKEGNAEMAH